MIPYLKWPYLKTHHNSFHSTIPYQDLNYIMVITLLKKIEVACTKIRGLLYLVMHMLVATVVLLFTVIQCFLPFTCVMELMAYFLGLIYLAQFAWIDLFWNIWQNSWYRNNAVYRTHKYIIEWRMNWKIISSQRWYSQQEHKIA